MKKIIVVIALFGAAYSAKAQRLMQLVDTLGNVSLLAGGPSNGLYQFPGGAGGEVVTLGSSLTKTSGNIIVADGTTQFASVPLSGDAALTSAGALTIAKINGKTLDATALAPSDKSIFIYDASANGGLGAWVAHALSVGVTLNATSGAVTITDGIVTYAKIQNVTDGKLLGRSTGANGPPMEITVGSGLSLSGGTLSATGGSSYGTVAAGATITIPNSTTVVRITNESAVANNDITMPSGTDGQILYIFNNDAQDTGATSGPVITSGQTAQFIYANGSWRRVAP
jgi:hypothetical protein